MIKPQPQRRVNWTISEAAYEAASEMSSRHGSLSKVVEIAIDRMYREEKAMRESSTAAKAGILPSDGKAVIAAKLRAWIDSTLGDEPEPYKADQALLAWNAIHVTWGRNPDGFAEAWGEHAPGALDRQQNRWGV